MPRIHAWLAEHEYETYCNSPRSSRYPAPLVSQRNGIGEEIAVVEVALLSDGEYVRAESRPVDASQSHAAELLAIRFAADWCEQDCVIFSDNRGAVELSRKTFGDILAAGRAESRG